MVVIITDDQCFRNHMNYNVKRAYHECILILHAFSSWNIKFLFFLFVLYVLSILKCSALCGPHMTMRKKAIC